MSKDRRIGWLASTMLHANGKKPFVRPQKTFQPMPISEAALEGLVVMGAVMSVAWALWAWGSLFREAAGIVLLAAAALIVEFAGRRRMSDGSGFPQLRPRRSLSSGILLGAVTLPLVLSSRLLQLLRCSSPTAADFPPAPETLLRFEFWLAVACSASMLALLASFSRERRGGGWTFATLAEYATIALLVWFTAAGPGLRTSWILLWIGVYVLGGKALFVYVLRAFPGCGTLGEVMLVVEGIVLYGANAVAASVPERREVDRPVAAFSYSGNLDIDEQRLMNALMQGVILGLLIVPVIYGILHARVLPCVLRYVPFAKSGGSGGLHAIFAVGMFYAVLVAVMFAAVPRWVRAAAGVRPNLVLWVVDFVAQQPKTRLLLCAYWVIVVCTPLPRLYRISTSGQVPKSLVRKYYHAMIVVMFVPALLLDAEFLGVAFVVALAGFLILEMVRVWCLPPVGSQIRHFMAVFADERDAGALVVSHFSLLLGCALPVWLNSGSGDRPLASFAGILGLGVGDAVASVVGHNFGSSRVSHKSEKTWEGTAGGILAVLGSWAVIVPMLSLAMEGAWAWGQLFPLVAATVAGGLLEAFVLQLDNAFIPLLFYSLLCL